MSGDLVLAIDQGTTGTTAMLVDHDVQVLASHNVEFPNHYPEPGHVEHDTGEIWESVGEAVEAILSRTGVSTDRIAAIGITNQRETTVLWDAESGRPIHRALCWQDRRTAGLCEDLQQQGHESEIRHKTGLVLDPYFSGTKAKWLLDHVDGARDLAAAGRLRFGTIDTWLTWRLTGEHVTDPSNASRTLLFDLRTLDWSDELCEILTVPRQILPRVGSNSEVFGTTRGVGFLPDGIPVAGLIGDQQGALFGQACFEQGMAKCTYGTGAFVLMNTGPKPRSSGSGMLTTVAWTVDGETDYALEGSAFIAGAAVQWLRDGLGVIDTAAEIEELAAQVEDTGGVFFVPALSGLGAPHWRPEARGLLCGLTRGTTRAHVARAVLDGVALQIVDILDAMVQDLGAPLAELRVDGGAARNDLLMQRQADLVRTKCVRPQELETTGLGSGLLAGLAVGLWQDRDEVASTWAEDRTFLPEGDAAEIAATMAGWRKALELA